MDLEKETINLPKGVLKIKRGYNPNSSSIGTVVYSFPLASALIGVIIGVITVFLKKGKSKK
jgi:hypothetical protein